MPVPTTSRRSVVARVVAATATVAAGLGAAAFVVPSAEAGTSTKFTVTNLSTHRLPASTANQIITLTGTGFDEDLISGVTINGCTTAPTYAATSATSLVVKTADDCTTGSTGAITITDTSSDTYVTNPAATGGKLALAFADAPTIATPSGTVKPVKTDNTAAAAYGDQKTTASNKGGTVIRVLKGSVAFVNTTQYPLSASLGGVALTKVTMPVGGAYFTGTLGAHAVDAAPVLKVTSNGVTKSFPYATGTTAGTHQFQYAGTSISVSPTSTGLAGGVISITGTGFTASTTATVGGVNCPVSGTPTATLFKCTAAAVTSAGVQAVVATTGSVVSVTSATSNFTFLDE